MVAKELTNLKQGDNSKAMPMQNKININQTFDIFNLAKRRKEGKTIQLNS